MAQWQIFINGYNANCLRRQLVTILILHVLFQSDVWIWKRMAVLATIQVEYVTQRCDGSTWRWTFSHLASSSLSSSCPPFALWRSPRGSPRTRTSMMRSFVRKVSSLSSSSLPSSMSLSHCHNSHRRHHHWGPKWITRCGSSLVLYTIKPCWFSTEFKRSVESNNALYWKNSKRQISIHLTVLKLQNAKTSLHKLSKNHWVFALLAFLGSVRKRLQFTVFFTVQLQIPV